MSVAASHTEIPAEPFGQTGIRQYAGRIMAWLFLTVGLCAAAMNHRSSRFYDDMAWSGRGQKLEIRSSGGQLAVIGSGRQGATGEGNGWTFGGGYDRSNRDPQSRWRTEVGRLIGVEAFVGPPRQNDDSGFYFRASWNSIAALFLIWPLVYGVRKIVRAVRPRVD